MKSFIGKTAFVFGGSSGIGKALANLLVKGSADVVIFSRDQDRLDAAVADIGEHRSLPGQRIACRRVDVTDADMVRSVAESSVTSFGSPALLVNCAGQAVAAYAEDIDDAAFDHLLKLNLYGTRHTIMAHLPHMAAGSHILNVSSVAGLVGVFGFTAYCASKFGVVGFSEALRAEMRPRGIGVSVLCPPDTDTPGLQRENETKPPETKAISGRSGVLRAEAVALSALNGVRRGRFLIVPGADGLMTYLLSRWMPWLVRRVMDMDVGRVSAANRS